MASAWGGSWADTWGISWGSNAPPASQPTGGDTSDPLFYEHWRQLAEQQHAKPPVVSQIKLPAAAAAELVDPDLDELTEILELLDAARL